MAIEEAAACTGGEGRGASAAATADRAMGRPAAAGSAIALLLAFGLDLYAHARGISVWVEPGTEQHVLTWVQLTLWLLPTLLLTCAAVWIYLARPRSLVAALISLSFLLIGSSNFTPAHYWIRASAWSGENGTLIAETLSHAGWLGLILTFLIFPDGTFRPRWTRWAAVAATAYSAVDLLRVFLTAKEFLKHNELLTAQSYFGGVAFLLAGTMALHQRAGKLEKAKRDVERQRLRCVETGLAIGAAFLLVGNAFLCLAEQILKPLAEQGVDWASAAKPVLEFAGVGQCALGFAAIAGGFLVALLCYRLFDAEALLSSSASYGTLSLIFLGLMALAQQTIKDWLSAHLQSETVAQIAMVIVAAAVIAPLNGAIKRWTERKVRGPLAELGETLPATLAELRLVASVREIAADVARRIEAAVRPTRLAVVVDGAVEASRPAGDAPPGQWLEQQALDPDAEPFVHDENDPLFPLRVPLRVGAGAEPVGWLLLGPRPDGSFYGKDELAALEQVAGPIARAIRAVKLREREQSALAALAGAKHGAALA